MQERCFPACHISTKFNQQKFPLAILVHYFDLPKKCDFEFIFSYE